jgi:hypothetical protein
MSILPQKEKLDQNIHNSDFYLIYLKVPLHAGKGCNQFKPDEDQLDVITNCGLPYTPIIKCIVYLQTF